MTLITSVAAAAPFAAGADVSALKVLEDNGAWYTDNGVPGDVIEMFSDHGVNWYRLRLFVDPNGENTVVQDIPYTIALAQRAKAAGGNVLLDFHYSDTWADPGKQFKPAAWNSLSFSQLEDQVYDYTKDVIEQFDAAGVLPEMVQIGNEISNGMLWDDGRLWRPGVPESTEFDNLAALLSAGIQGARDGASVGQEPDVMIHFADGGNWGGSSYYFDRLLPRLQTNGTDIDVIGYSYYPKWHYNPDNGNGGMADLISNLNNTASTYGKKVAIAEAGFPSWGAQWEPDYEFDVSEQGQTDYLQALVDALQDVPNDRGMGLFYWFPEAQWVSNDIDVWEGGRYGLFDQNKELLPAIDVFANIVEEITNTSIGDYNGDNIVDGADYTYWRDTMGLSVPSGTAADGNDNGIVDAGDYTVWVDNFGEIFSGGSGAGSGLGSPAVPEPSSAVLAALALLGLFAGRARARA